jgi:hypothetical protein
MSIVRRQCEEAALVSRDSVQGDRLVHHRLREEVGIVRRQGRRRNVLNRHGNRQHVVFFEYDVARIERGELVGDVERIKRYRET